MPRVTPVTGTDADRLEAGYAGLFLKGEIHTTEQIRMFLRNRYIGPRWHGEVADEAAMLALNTSSPYGCFPADKCLRIDTSPPTVWECISGRGTTLAKWMPYAGSELTEDILSGGDFIGTSSDEIVGGDFVSEPVDTIVGGDIEPAFSGGNF